MEEKIHISVVSPVYKAGNIVDELVKQIVENVSQITNDFEVILVEDCSPDNSWKKIEDNCKKYPRVKGIKLSRNFGQHYAITAGLHNAKGEWIVVMDCDLQDRPDEIPNLYKKAMEGYHTVVAKRIIRNDSFFKKLLSKIFYSFFSYLTETKQDASLSNFGIYHKSVIEAILSMKDAVRPFSVMVQWVGFKKISIPVKHSQRFEGRSTYTLFKLIKWAIDIIIGFSDKTLKMIVKIGFAITIVSFCVGIYYFIGYLMGIITLAGFTSLIISLWFLSGMIILILGILGLYIGKIFEKVKERPSFIIDRKENFGKKIYR